MTSIFKTWFKGSGIWSNYGKGILTQRSKEPPIFASRIPLLKRLLDRLLCIFPLCRFLKRILSQHTLQSLQLHRVSRWHQMVVVDRLDEGLDLAVFCLTS